MTKKYGINDLVRKVKLERMEQIVAYSHDFIVNDSPFIVVKTIDNEPCIININAIDKVLPAENNCVYINGTLIAMSIHELQVLLVMKARKVTNADAYIPPER